MNSTFQVDRSYILYDQGHKKQSIVFLPTWLWHSPSECSPPKINCTEWMVQQECHSVKRCCSFALVTSFTTSRSLLVAFFSRICIMMSILPMLTFGRHVFKMAKHISCSWRLVPSCISHRSSICMATTFFCHAESLKGKGIGKIGRNKRVLANC